MAVSVGETILVSLKAVITVVIIYLFGMVLAGKFKKIDRKGLQTVSTLAASLFIPCFYIAR